MKVKSAMMKAPGNFTVSSNTGHTIRFEANKETFVPGVMVRACKKYGAVETKRFKDTVVDIPAPAAKVHSGIHAARREPDMEAIEEVTLAEVSTDKEEADATESDRYTQKENRVRGVIANLMAVADEKNFTDEGTPKVTAINKELQDFTISADTRNEIWGKMNQLGDVPSDWYAEEEDG